MSEALAILKEAGSLLEGHFVGNSGRHLSVYINKDAWMPRTDYVSRICRLLAETAKDKNIDVVVGPAVGGIPLSTWTAHHLSDILGRPVLSVFSEKTPENGQELKRGYDKLVQGKRILAVEDTVTTGGSVKKTIEAVQNAGGIVAALAIVINRDPKQITETMFGVPFTALAELEAPSFAEEEVPEWLRKIPINTTVGHGKKYCETHPEANCQ